MTTQPAGATVSVDGVALSDSAEQPLSLPIGTHAVQLEKPGYLPIKKTVDVLADVENELGPLVFDVGTSPLEVMTEPASMYLKKINGFAQSEACLRAASAAASSSTRKTALRMTLPSWATVASGLVAVRSMNCGRLSLEWTAIETNSASWRLASSR